MRAYLTAQQEVMIMKRRLTFSLDLEQAGEQIAALDLDDLTTLLENVAEELRAPVGASQAEDDKRAILAERMVHLFGSVLYAVVTVDGYACDSRTLDTIQSLWDEVRRAPRDHVKRAVEVVAALKRERAAILSKSAPGEDELARAQEIEDLLDLIPPSDSTENNAAWAVVRDFAKLIRDGSVSSAPNPPSTRSGKELEDLVRAAREVVDCYVEDDRVEMASAIENDLQPALRAVEAALALDTGETAAG